jgi:probable O-glycosylation ligase (exosortase A-associated)
MMNLIVIALVALCIPLAIRYPLIGACLYIWFDYVAPDRMFSGPLTESARVSLLLGLATWLGIFVFEPIKKLPRTVSFYLLLLFFAWASLTTVFAIIPDGALDKWDRFSKNLLILFALTILIDTKERLHVFLIAVFAATSLHAVRGAALTIVTGGGGLEIVGTATTYLQERNYIAIAFLTAAIIGIYLWKNYEVATWKREVRWAIIIGMVCNVISVVGTQSRGALVGAAAVGAVLIIVSKQRTKAIVGLLALSAALFFLAPDSWLDRMRTIDNYNADAAVTSRFDSWKWGWEMALAHPIFGGGYSIYFLNKHEQSMRGYFDAHSVYFEVLGEHGFVGLAIYLVFILSMIISSMRLNRYFKAQHIVDLANAAKMAFLINVAIFTAGIFGVLSPFMMTYVGFVTQVGLHRIARELKLTRDKEASVDSPSISKNLLRRKPA